MVRKGRISEAEQDQAQALISFSDDLDSVGDCEFVLEAVGETLLDKLAIFGRLDRIVRDPDAVLATNTSSIPIMKIGSATADPGRVVGVHFFNPVPAMALVELIGSLHTAQATIDRASAFVTGTLGKQVIRCRDSSGFVVNALLVPYLLAAVRMLESGAASAEEIDQAMTLGCGHPMGPLALSDLIGLDTVAAIGAAMYEEMKQPLYAPPPLLLRMVDGGLIGKKGGRGFYDYR
jgi:3-hydroxybutyryl-CoA dehydrogenase